MSNRNLPTRWLPAAALAIIATTTTLLNNPTAATFASSIHTQDPQPTKPEKQDKPTPKPEKVAAADTKTPAKAPAAIPDDKKPLPPIKQPETKSTEKPSDNPQPETQKPQPKSQPEISESPQPEKKKIAAPTLPQNWMNELNWRSVGPANMSGRITDIAINPKDHNIWWVASASGGLLKTTNNGTTFTHQFDHQHTVSIGDVEVAPSNPDIVWVGTGEANPRNSVSWGDGVYKSTDGGETWTHMGLDKTFQIGEIKIDPENPDIVYVAALGRLWGPNEERGLYKTTDGGKTWEKSFYIDDQTGVIDIDLKPDDPDTILIATYQRKRDGFDSNDPATRWGPGAGIYKSSDAGKTWQQISDGLPSSKLGRVGIDYYKSNPDIVYAVIETENIGNEPENAAYMGIRATDAAEVGAKLTEITEDGPAEKAGFKKNDIVIELDGEPVLAYEGLLASIRKHLAHDTVEIKVSRDRKPVTLEVTFDLRPGAMEDAEEGKDKDKDKKKKEDKKKKSPFRTWLGGQVPNAQDQQGPNGAENGGIFKSEDGGESWTRINSLNPRPMYFSEIRVDPSDNNYLYVAGISLYKSKDGGKTFTDDGGKGGVHVDHHAMWVDPDDGRHILLGNDGGLYETHDRMENWDHIDRFAIGQFYHIAVGPRDNYRIYGGLQDNGSWGGPSRVRRGQGPRNSDWFRIGGGDGFLCIVDPDDPDQLYAESQEGGMVRYNLRTGDRSWMRPRAPKGIRYRFNWKTPFLLSPHNSKIYYSAGNFVFRSLFKGNDMKAISPDITNTDKGSATALTESAVEAGVLYAGTDDGALWRTKNAGQTWDRLYGIIPEKTPETDENTPETKHETKQNKPKNDKTAQKVATKIHSIPKTTTTTKPKNTPDTPKTTVKTPDTPATPQKAPSTKTPPSITAPDPVSGTWSGKVISDQLPEGQGDFELTLTLKNNNKVTGQIDSEMGLRDIENGSYNPKTKKISFSIDEEGMTADLTATLNPDKKKMEGEASFADGQFTMDFEANRTAGPDTLAKSEGESKAGDTKNKEEAKEPKVDPRTIKPISNLADLIPGPRWVSSLEASRYKKGRIYMTLDGHRSDDDLPYVFVSEDYGTTWKSLTTNLPDNVGSAKVLREDIKNQNILYLGTEFSAWVSVDRGETWDSLNTNLPTVAVHEIAQHPTRGEIVAGTHGRSAWILDVTPLRQMTKEAIADSVHLYKPNTAYMWEDDPSSSETLRAFQGENPEWGVRLFYSYRDNAGKGRLVIKDITGRIIKEFDPEGRKGLHSILWDLRMDPSGRQRRGPRVSPGTYLVELTVGTEVKTQTLTVKADPDHPEATNYGIAYDEMLEQMQQMNEEETEHPNQPETDTH